MHQFTLYLSLGRVVISSGNNLIDACLKSSEAVDFRQVNSYQEDGGQIIYFAK